MDLTTLFAAIGLAFGLLTFETIRTSDRVVLEVASLPAVERMSIDQETVEHEFAYQLDRVARVVSVVVPPEIKSKRDVGVGQAIGSALKIDELARAIEADLGYTPDRLRLAMFTENGRLAAVISGRGRKVGPYRLVLHPYEAEPLLDFVRRCSLTGASYLAPYGTTLFLLQEGVRNRDLSAAKRLSDRAKAALPDTPESFERSLLLNVDGLIALFEGDVALAHEKFLASIAASNRNPSAALNAAFTAIQQDHYAEAETRLAALLEKDTPSNAVLLSSLHTTRAAAWLGMGRTQDADREIRSAVAINPNNSSAWFLWSEIRETLGDLDGARKYRRTAYEKNDTIENYAEVAALYFLVPWRPGSALIESPFRNPDVVIPGR